MVSSEKHNAKANGSNWNDENSYGMCLFLHYKISNELSSESQGTVIAKGSPVQSITGRIDQKGPLKRQSTKDQ